VTRLFPILTLTLAILVFAPEAAHACAVCFDANEETRGAFLGTTIFLSLLPLGIIGGTAYWLWRRARSLGAEDGTLGPGDPLR
jgi:hypothetical protein